MGIFHVRLYVHLFVGFRPPFRGGDEKLEVKKK